MFSQELQARNQPAASTGKSLPGAPSEGAAIGFIGRLGSPEALLRIVLLLTFVSYLPAIAFDFVWDDRLLIVMNPWMESWRYVPAFFTKHMWAFDGFHIDANFYRPLFLLWLFLIKHSTGGAPGWFHLAAIGLHLCVIVEVYALTCLLTQEAGVAVIAAMIFALHPAKVEAVAWISGMTEVLCAVLLFATLICWLRWERSRRAFWRLSSLALFALSLLAKESAILVPVLLGIYEWHKDEGTVMDRARSVLARLWPFGVLTGGYMAWRWHTLHGLSETSLAAGGYTTLLSAPGTILQYIGHLIWPIGLTYFYEPTTVSHFSWRLVGLPAIVLTAIAIVLWRAAGRTAAGAMLFWWFPLTLAPVIASVTLVQIHDRYLYLPSFSFAVGAAWMIAHPRMRGGGAIKTSHAALAAALGVALAVGTIRESRPWDNEVSLLERSVQKAPSYAPGRWFLAGAYMDAGRPEDAHRVLTETTLLFPNELKAWELLGRFEYERANLEAAQAAFAHVLTIPADPHSKDFSLYSLGLIAQARGDLPKAEAWYRRALDADPSSQGARQSLNAVLRLEQKDTNRSSRNNTQIIQ